VPAIVAVDRLVMVVVTITLVLRLLLVMTTLLVIHVMGHLLWVRPIH